MPDTRPASIFLTRDLPPIAGTLRQRPEDFLVDELPSYDPCGQGEHLYLTIQKRNMSTMDLLRLIAAHFRVGRGAVGYAGLKDKHAVTRQVVSVHIPGKSAEDFPALEHPDLVVLGAALHTNKLRPGHLRGNRFSIRIRDCRPTDSLVAHRVLRRLEAEGVPNRFGAQRFGLLGNTHRIGRALAIGDFDTAVRELLGPSSEHPERNADARRLYLEGRYREASMAYPRNARTELIVLNMLAQDRSPREAFLRLDDSVLHFYISAFQSAVFNAVLDDRLAGGRLGRLEAGDLAFKHANGAIFAVDEGVADDPTTAARLASLEISPTGPLWGAAMPRAGGATDAVELAQLRTTDVTPEALAARARSRPSLTGARRPLRVPLIAPEVEGGVDEHGPYIRCAFELPRGAFATTVLREILKPSDHEPPLSEEA
ncbi:MAG: tRNA pseudouridine synthase D [Phycisphaerae bacterium]|nr:MAG: tRNA pseudouridine synthase D [Phycisphaerae bacterium]